MNRTTFRLIASCLIATTVVCNNPVTAQRPGVQPGNQATRKPNVVIILGDDLGYCDTGLYGCKDIPTPNINSIASKGVLFTNGYVTAPVCSPSRAGLMTGRYQHRFGFEFNAGALQRAINNKEMGLPTTEITLADSMKKAGYKTGMVGKWHLGMHEKFHPNKRGFDEYFGFLFGANSYIDSKLDGVASAATANEGAVAWPRNPQNPVLRNQSAVEENEYLTDAFARETVAFIERHKSEPFFLYAPFNAPHTPLQVTKKYLDRFPHIKDEKRRIYAAMVSALDTAVGAILTKLRQTGLEKDTLVVFSSDNGCATYTGACVNDPLRYGKLTHLEGGFRVPFAMQYPGKLKAGMVYDKVTSTLDLFPTAVNLAGGEIPKDRPYDGVDLMPYLLGKNKAAPHDALYWRNSPNSAIRKGNWKMFMAGDQVWLFDLSNDLGEKKNLAKERPEIVDRLKKEFARWEAQLKQPMWPCREAPGEWEFEGVRLKICI